MGLLNESAVFVPFTCRGLTGKNVAHIHPLLFINGLLLIVLRSAIIMPLGGERRKHRGIKATAMRNVGVFFPLGIVVECPKRPDLMVRVEEASYTAIKAI